MGAYPSSQKVEGTVALSALFLQLGWEGVTDFATGGLAARSSVQSVTVPPKGLLMPMSVPGTLSPLSGEVPLRTTLLRPPLLPVGPTASGTVEPWRQYTQTQSCGGWVVAHVRSPLSRHPHPLRRVLR